jgi:SAM-dependent methyltransferase
MAPGRRVLDVGCGTGELLAYLHDQNFTTFGLEPSPEAVEAAQKRGLKVTCSTLNEFVADQIQKQAEGFDAITTLNVLEHVPNPVEFIQQTKRILSPGGILCIRVPNDFTEIQASAQAAIGRDPWWVAIPDHVNYFNFENLPPFLERLGFEVAYVQGDFPMELFLLMGDNYVATPQLGGQCHQKRVAFEMALPGELRRRLYQKLAEAGIGRDCLVFARLKGS